MSQFLAEIRDIYLNQILTEEKKEDEEDYGEKYESKYKKSGKKSKDYDGDGEVEDESDEYAGVKDKAIKGKSKKKNEDEDLKTESFSDWRSESNLFEVASRIAEKEAAKIKDGKRNNKIKINPTIAEDFTILDEQELNEEFLMETVDYAAEHLYEMGLNEKGLEMVIESLGEDQFVEYIFNITEDLLLTEARRSGLIEPVTKTGKNIGSLKGAAKASSIKSKEKEKAARKEAEAKASAAKPSGMTAALKRQSEIAKKVTTDRGNRAVQTAVSQQPKTKTKSSETKDSIAKGILGVISGAQKQYEKGMARHRAAMNVASQTAKVSSDVAKTAAKAAKVVGGGIASGIRVATGLETPSGKETKLGRNVAAASYKGARKATRAVRDVAAKEVARRRVKAQTNESIQYILEKAVSEQQQKIFGLALAVKRGEVSRSKVSDRVLEIADGMSEAEIRKFAATAHAGIPKRKA